MDNLIGKILDGLYEVQELIGSGGMANVYKAVMRGQNGPVPAGTVVAVKVLRSNTCFHSSIEKYRRASIYSLMSVAGICTGFRERMSSS